MSYACATLCTSENGRCLQAYKGRAGVKDILEWSSAKNIWN